MVRLLLIFFFLICSPVFAKTIPELNSNTSPTTSDLTYTVDVSDTTDGSSGTGKKATIAQVFKAANMTIDGTNVGVNSLAPGARLDVVGTVRATAFSGDGSGLSNVAGAVSDASYSASWDGDTTTPASKNAIYDKIETIATGSGGWTDGGTNVYVSTSTDKVGIGSTTPRAKLDVIGAGYFDDTVTVGGSSQIQFTTNGETISNTNDGYNDFSGGITTGGNIGVGTITASTRLTVNGTATATAFSGPLTGNVTGNASTATALAANGANCPAGEYPLGVDASGVVEGCTVAGGSSGWTDAGTDIYNTTTSDNVGIGTTTPTSKLTVAGSITTSGTTAGSVVLSEASANGTETITLSAPDSVAASKAFTLPSSYGSNGDVLTSDGAGALSFTTPASASGGWTDGGTNVYTTTTTDTVGIGTTTPNAATLEIVKQSSVIPLKISSTASGSGNLLILTSGGNLGVGTLTPASKIHIMDDLAGYSDFFTLQDLTDPGTGATVLTIKNSVSNLGVRAYGSTAPNFLANAVGLIGSSNNMVNGVGTSKSLYMFSNNAYTAPQFTLTSGGNIGISTTLPNSKLAVGGGQSIGATYASTAAPSNGLIVQGNVGLGTTAPSNNIDFGTTNAVQWPAQKSSSGTRYLCIDSVGVITSSASACSGT